MQSMTIERMKPGNQTYCIRRKRKGKTTQCCDRLI